MFIGEYSHSLDSKNRMIVPAKLREGLGEKFVITKGLDGCLYAYPISEWEMLEEKLKKLPLTNKDARAFVRFGVRKNGENIMNQILILIQLLKKWAI